MKNIKKNMSEGDFIQNSIGFQAIFPEWSLERSLAAYECSLITSESKINLEILTHLSDISTLLGAYSRRFDITFTSLNDQSLDNKRMIIAQIKSLPEFINVSNIPQVHTSVKKEVIDTLSYGHEGFTSNIQNKYSLPSGYPHLPTVTPDGITNDIKAVRTMGSYGAGGFNHTSIKNVDDMRKGINDNLSSDPVHSAAELWGGEGPVEGATTPEEINAVNSTGTMYLLIY
jgi:hypothetical protein